MLKIASWNVNSLRVRLPQITDWITQNRPTVLALQETKLEDDKCPQEVFKELGYQVVLCGQKSYNGVMILSLEPLEDLLRQMPGSEDPQKRFIAATIFHNQHPLRIINLYVPNGQSVGSEKYYYKLNWLEQLEAFLQEEMQRHPNILLMGDFNIAPEPEDVYDPKKWEGRILFSLPERAHFKKMLALGLHDAFRLMPQEPNVFSWWDYRTFGFRRNHGLRIDHILITHPLVSHTTHCYIDKAVRGAIQPSDHAPVIIELSL